MIINANVTLVATTRRDISRNQHSCQADGSQRAKVLDNLPRSGLEEGIKINRIT
jgi:hypothetical protein